VNKIILAIDQLSKTVGHAFAWCIVILTLGTCYEVFVRYALNDPTSWAFDLSYLMYGAVFYMAGAYTLSRGGHVRADMFYRKWPVRTQAVVELVLYLLFFFPGILALIVAGGAYGFESMRIREVSVNSPAGVPIWPLKMMIQFGAGLIALQGVAEVLRCIVCLREGQWPARLHDVEELEQQLLEQHAQKHAAAAGAAPQQQGARP
jgi:TRAP-type mannitol/chloroaromatic compound transport system permease small subunit